MSGVSVDTSELAGVEKALTSAERRLADPGNTRMATASARAANELSAALRASAAVSPTPQARIVAESLVVTPGREAAVSIGGGRRVGSRGTPAGEIVYGSESGGANFGAPRGGSYWIAPAVTRYSAGGGEQAYTDAINGILRDVGLL